MFDIHCRECAKRYLVGARSITAFRNTADGPVAAVRCPSGHTVLHAFHGRPAAALPEKRSPAHAA